MFFNLINKHTHTRVVFQTTSSASAFGISHLNAIARDFIVYRRYKCDGNRASNHCLVSTVVVLQYVLLAQVYPPVCVRRGATSKAVGQIETLSER